MPRDFVPCLYYERVEAQPETGEPVLCCDVIELFATCRLDTQAPDVIVSNNSHQHTMRDTESVDPYVDLSPVQRSAICVLWREGLFSRFYAAMAALE